MKQAKVLNEKEFKRVMAVAGAGRYGERNQLALMLSHFAGLRVGEIAHLKIGDVTGPVREGSGVNVLDQIYLNPSYTKGGYGRTVMLNAKLVKAIKNYLTGLSALSEPLSTRRREQLLGRNAPLIASQRRQHFTANSLCQLFGKLFAEAGIVGASSHSGRRHFITRLAHAGISPKVIMELAGHRQLTTTQRYIDVSEQMKREAVEVL